jgi:DNA polymerase-1
MSYTEACNTPFSGMGGDMMKHALFALQRACYVGSLKGCRPVNVVHDEYVVEVPEEFGHECAEEMSRVILTAANEWLPDVPVKGDVLLCRRWSKLAHPVRDANGRLIPWEMENVTG